MHTHPLRWDNIPYQRILVMAHYRLPPSITSRHLNNSSTEFMIREKVPQLSFASVFVLRLCIMRIKLPHPAFDCHLLCHSSRPCEKVTSDQEIQSIVIRILESVLVLQPPSYGCLHIAMLLLSVRRCDCHGCVVRCCCDDRRGHMNGQTDAYG